VQPSRAELASWDFVLVQYVVRHPWPFLLVLGGCLVALSAVFCLQVKLAYFDWASLPVDSPLRPAFESLLYDFRGAGKSDLQLFLQTGPDLRVTNESFVRALDSLCSQLEQQWFVSDVGSMVRLDANLSVADYVDIYAAPASAGNIGYSQQVLDPFFLSDLQHIARVSVGVALLPSDKRLGKAVRQVRSLVRKGFFSEPSATSMLQRAGVTGSAARQVDTLADLRRVLPGFIAVVGQCLIICSLLSHSPTARSVRNVRVHSVAHRLAGAAREDHPHRRPEHLGQLRAAHVRVPGQPRDRAAAVQQQPQLSGPHPAAVRVRGGLRSVAGLRSIFAGSHSGAVPAHGRL